MPRRLRNSHAGSLVHAVNRGNDKRVLFDHKWDFEAFLELVSWAKAHCTVRIVAYCVMSNHWHFILWPLTDSDVTRFLHRLTCTHAMRWRKQTRTVGCGHVYQGRYRGDIIGTESYYFNALRYVESNPLRANLVSTSADWRWSSLIERRGYDRGILDDGPLELPAGWARLVDESLPDPVIAEIRKSVRKH